MWARGQLANTSLNSGTGLRTLGEVNTGLGAGWGWGCHQSALNVQAPTSALPTVTKTTVKPTPWSQGVSVEVASVAEEASLWGRISEFG